MEEKVRDLLKSMAEEVPPQRSSNAFEGRIKRARVTGIVASASLTLVVIAIASFAWTRVTGGEAGQDGTTKPADRGGPEGEGGDLEGQISFVVIKNRPVIELQSIDGSASEALPIDADGISGIDWAPDGRRLAVGLGTGEGSGQIILFDASTGESSVLISGEDSPFLLPQNPRWSPDGKRISFNSETGDVYVLGADGTDLTAVTESGDSCSDTFPSWAPNNDKLAFTRECNGARIYTVDLKTKKVSPITDGPADYFADWSPDGDEIVFSRELDNLFAVSLDTGKLRQLTNKPENYQPSWSPDGDAIIFTSNRDGNQDIYVVQADGTGERRITTDPSDETLPVWRP